jgi:hypothetical protein
VVKCGTDTVPAVISPYHEFDNGVCTTLSVFVDDLGVYLIEEALPPAGAFRQRDSIGKTDQLGPEVSEDDAEPVLTAVLAPPLDEIGNVFRSLIVRRFDIYIRIKRLHHIHQALSRFWFRIRDLVYRGNRCGSVRYVGIIHPRCNPFQTRIRE